MFVVLQAVCPVRTSFFARIRNLFCGARLNLVFSEVRGVEFATLRIEGTCRPRDWKKISDICRKYRGRIIIPAGLRIPSDAGITTADFPRFRQRVLVDTACEIVSRSEIPIFRRIAGLIDMNGDKVHLLRPLLKYYSCVRVVTDNLDLYEREAEVLMREFGAPVLTGCELDMLGDCVLVLAPKLFENPEGISIAAPTMTESILCDTYIPQCITSLRVHPEGDILRACPESIEQHQFAAALYEFCGVDIGNYVAGEMLYAYRQTSFSETVRMVTISVRNRWK